MNCKPRDLAMYVGFVQDLRGFIFKCVRLENYGGISCWKTDPPPPKGRNYLAIGLVRDESLRPIRPSNISDEEVRDLYLPKQPEVA